MNLQFDNLAELTEFLAWVRTFSSPVDYHIEVSPSPGKATGASYPACDPQIDALIDVPKRSHPLPAANWENPEAAPAAAPRKRRTKAEMEAARAAEVAEQVAAADAVEPEAEPEVTPAANAGMRAILDAPNGQAAVQAAAAVLANAAPLDEPATDTKSKSVHFERPAAEHAASWIRNTAAVINSLDAAAHLNACREFIAKHGMNKYQESFPLCALDTNVLGYDDKQAALHAAALQWLDWE
jgi:hypothetical protein